MLKLGIILCLYLATAHTAPNLVVTTEQPTEKEQVTESNAKEDAYPSVPKIYEMRVESNVTNRFGTTLVTSKVKNLGKKAQEATFSVVLPETAYISGFVMEIGGKSYKAYVKEKEEAKQIYNEAVQSGQSAAHVEANARDSRRFTVSLNIEPQTKAVFKLSYEELLQRQNGKYEIVINIHPGQPVKNLDVVVNINETRPLKFINTPPLRSGNEISKNDVKLEPNAVINKVNNNSCTVKFSPDEEQQKQLAGDLGTPEENGLAGQFIVQYDVERDPFGGEVLVKDGYFVHFFAPEDKEPLPKHVVFVLDTSGSMGGIRIRQLKEAMNSILSELKNEDVFNIVEFSSVVKVWNIAKVEVQYEEGLQNPWGPPEPSTPERRNQTLPPAFEADDLNKANAKQVVEKLDAFGGTDIKAALEVGLKIVKKQLELDTKHQSMIVFLTDGEPTSGEVDTEKITTAIEKLNAEAKTPLFSLSFGDGADRDFLQKISLKNNGFARHIYESADASLQLQEFYKKISSPVLSNVQFKYVSNVTKVTKTIFPIFFRGSEIVVAGEGVPDGTILSWGKGGPIDLTPKVEETEGALERLWAYVTLKQVLEARDAAASDSDKTGLTKKALDLALKYSFVTPVSSLVVVKPNDTNAVDTEDASKSSNAERPYFMRGIAAPYPAVAAQIPAYAPIPYGFSSRPKGGGGFGAGSYLTSSASAVGLAGPPGYWAPQPASDNQPVAEAEAVDSRITGGSAVPKTPEEATTVAVPTTTTAPTNSILDYLKTNLPWLASILNDDETLKSPTGNYKLGTNANVTTTPQCPKTPGQTTPGVCQLLHKCPTVYTLLKDANDFEQYFCALGEYAGICCPS